ncbi:MAG: DUF1493 family protein [Pirellulales bacterium]|nr:DUF1493 family protein [Pirellulales bacterium]
MVIDEGVLADVCELVRQHAGKGVNLTAESTLFGDLGIWGDDAVELMTEFHHRFGVDLSHFDYSNHFLPEAYSCLQSAFLPCVAAARFFRRHLSRKTPEEAEHLVPITLSQLAEAVQMQSWPVEWETRTGHK